MKNKVTTIDKNGEKTKKIHYILSTIDGARIMASSLSNLVNYPCKGIHKLNVNMDTMIKNDLIFTQRWFNRIQIFYVAAKFNDQFDVKLKERSFNTCNFFNYDCNKFILLS